VFTRTIRLGKRSVVMEQWIARRKDAQLEAAAQAVVTGVVYDYGSNQSVPIPPEWRARVKAYEFVAPAE
jgi:acyl-CoA thioester hydrolase